MVDIVPQQKLSEPSLSPSQILSRPSGVKVGSYRVRNQQATKEERELMEMENK